MPLSDEDGAASIAELEKTKRESEREKETIRRKKEAKKRKDEAKLDRLRRERSVGTSFDGLTRGVSATGGLRQSMPNVPRGIAPKFPVECSPSEYIAW